MAKRTDAGWQALVLFREILKLHKTKLPPPMRLLGDTYVKEEFRAHISPGKSTRASPEQLHTFLEEWSKYRDMISGTADLPKLDNAPEGSVVTGIDRAGNLKEEIVESLTPDQQERLQRLRIEAARFGLEVSPNSKGPASDS